MTSTIISFIIRTFFSADAIKSIALKLLLKSLPPISQPADSESVQVWLEEIIHGGIGQKFVDAVPTNVDNRILDYADKTFLHSALTEPFCQGLAELLNNSRN